MSTIADEIRSLVELGVNLERAIAMVEKDRAARNNPMANDFTSIMLGYCQQHMEQTAKPRPASRTPTRRWMDRNVTKVVSTSFFCKRT